MPLSKLNQLTCRRWRWSLIPNSTSISQESASEQWLEKYETQLSSHSKTWKLNNQWHKCPIYGPSCIHEFDLVQYKMIKLNSYKHHNCMHKVKTQRSLENARSLHCFRIYHTNSAFLQLPVLSMMGNIDSQRRNTQSPTQTNGKSIL